MISSPYDSPTAHQPSLGVYQANAWSAPIGCSDYSFGFPLLRLAESDNASSFRIAAAVQSDSDICSEPRGEKRQRFSTVTCIRGLDWQTAAPARCRDITVETTVIYRHSWFVLGPAACSSSSPWQPCRCCCWPCRPHLSWPSPLCIFESSSKTRVRSFTQNCSFIM